MMEHLKRFGVGFCFLSALLSPLGIIALLFYLGGMLAAFLGLGLAACYFIGWAARGDSI